MQQKNKLCFGNIMSYFRDILDENDPSNRLEYANYIITRTIEKYDKEYNDGSIIYNYLYKYTIISKDNNIVWYTSILHRMGSYEDIEIRNPYIEDCDYRGKAYFFWPIMLINEIDFEPFVLLADQKFNLPLVVWLCV